MFGTIWAGTLSYSAVKLFSKYFNLCEKYTWKSQTDGRTMYCGMTALRVASRGKNVQTETERIKTKFRKERWWPVPCSLLIAVRQSQTVIENNCVKTLKILSGLWSCLTSMKTAEKRPSREGAATGDKCFCVYQRRGNNYVQSIVL